VVPVSVASSLAEKGDMGGRAARGEDSLILHLLPGGCRIIDRPWPSALPRDSCLNVAGQWQALQPATHCSCKLLLCAIAPWQGTALASHWQPGQIQSRLHPAKAWLSSHLQARLPRLLPPHLRLPFPYRGCRCVPACLPALGRSCHSLSRARAQVSCLSAAHLSLT